MQIDFAAAADGAAIAALLDSAFGPGRAARTASRLREGAAPFAAASFVARDGAALLGSVQCWPVALDDGRRSLGLTLLGPLAVAPAAQGQGIGGALMDAALAAVDAAGLPPVVLIGDAPYYARWGFTAAATGGWRLPGPFDPARLLLRQSDPALLLPRRAWLGPAVPAEIDRIAA